VTLLDRTLSFGAGGHEPYRHALRADGAARLVLESGRSRRDAQDVELERFRGPADATDRMLLRHLHGPLLDIGCGPGRMLVAARAAGLAATGIDVSAAAVELAAARGARALHGSVFEAVPWSGAWRSALLLDGNIGIGGDPGALLERCRELLAPGGVLVVETHPDRHRLRRFDGELVDGEGRRSARFPWAEVGARALGRLARRHAFAESSSVESDGRAFRFLVKIR
jgi:SAM-dependent methyltransferase